jgi:N-acyl-D-amino-acid deacylase
VPLDDAGRLNSWHTGSLPGTSTILIRRYDGLNIAVLFNSRVSPYVDHLTRALDGAPIHRALDEVRWPDQPAGGR